MDYVRTFKNLFNDIILSASSSEEIIWDAFISHASEDKQEIVKPLKEYLEKEGLKVWYDESELNLGDSLYEEIDKGLRNSRFGIVILSPHFFAEDKEWTKHEASALFATKGKRIIPVWHNLTSEIVKNISPLFAGKLAVSTEYGLTHVVEKILKVIKPECNEKPVISQKSDIENEDTKDNLVIRKDEQKIIHYLPSGFPYKMYRYFGFVAVAFIITYGAIVGFLKLYELVANDLHKKPVFLFSFHTDALGKKLTLAVDEGNTNTVKRLLNIGANPNTRYSSGRTVLIQSSCQGFKNIVKILLDEGADANILEERGGPLRGVRENTALMCAASEGFSDIVALLLDEGADANMSDYNGLTALMVTKEPAIATLLLNKGADIHKKDHQGNTAFLRSARTGSTDILNFLIDKGFDINERNDDGETALMIAAYYNRSTFVNALINKGADIYLRNNYGRDALSLASLDNINFSPCKDYGSVVEILMSYKDNLVTKDIYGNSYLTYAIQKRCNTHRQEDFQENSTHCSCLNSDISFIKKLIDKYNNINERNNNGMTPLFFAIKAGNIAIVQVLLDRGADINAATNIGTTGLMLAAMEGNSKIAEMLLDRGSSVDMQDNEGKNALIYAIIREDVPIVQELLDYENLINSPDQNGKTALMYAIEKNNTRIIRNLLHKGSDINAKDNQGKTPLMYAMYTKNIKIVELLLEKDVDINSEDVKGNTALIHILSKKEDHYKDDRIIEFLLKKGAYANTKSKYGYTPLIYAEENEKYSIIKTIQDYMVPKEENEFPSTSKNHQMDSENIRHYSK